MGFGPQVPWGPLMGFSRGPPPRFPVRYSQVIPKRGEQVYNQASGEPVINDGSRAEIKILHQQLAQAHEKQVALDSQINKLWELVQKQQGEFESKIIQVSDQGKRAISGKYRKTKGVGRRKKKRAS